MDSPLDMVHPVIMSNQIERKLMELRKPSWSTVAAHRIPSNFAAAGVPNPRVPTFNLNLRKRGRKRPMRRRRRVSRRLRRERKTWTMGRPPSDPNRLNAIIPARPYRLAQPELKPKFAMRTSNNKCAITGQDFLATVNETVAMDVAGTVIYDCLINPSQMSLTRLQMQCACWETYKFLSMKIVFKPTYPIQAGSLIGYIDTDPDEDLGPVGNVASLQAVMSHESAREIPVCETCEWVLPVSNRWANGLFADYNIADTRLTCAGRFILCIAVPLGISTTSAIGQLYAEYNIEMMHPQLDNNMAYGVAKCSSSTGVSSTHPLGTSITFNSWNSLIWKIEPVGSGTTFTLWRGTYLIYYTAVGTGVTAAGLTCTGATTGAAATQVVWNTCVNSAGTLVLSLTQIYMTTDDILVTVALGATTGSSMQLWIARLPDTALTIRESLISRAEGLIKRIQEIAPERKPVELKEKKVEFESKNDSPCIVVEEDIATSTSNEHILKPVRVASQHNGLLGLPIKSSK